MTDRKSTRKSSTIQSFSLPVHVRYSLKTVAFPQNSLELLLLVFIYITLSKRSWGYVEKRRGGLFRARSI